VSCLDAKATSFFAKVRGEVFAHFHAVAVKHHGSVRNRLFDLPGLILYKKNPLDVKENDEHALNFALRLSRIS
jgi:hypothetical protein